MAKFKFSRSFYCVKTVSIVLKNIFFYVKLLYQAGQNFLLLTFFDNFKFWKPFIFYDWAQFLSPWHSSVSKNVKKKIPGHFQSKLFIYTILILHNQSHAIAAVKKLEKKKKKRKLKVSRIESCALALQSMKLEASACIIRRVYIFYLCSVGC